MANEVTVEQLEALSKRLPSGERLRLVARICDQLSATLPEAATQGEEDQILRERLRLAKELLAEVEDVEDDAQGPHDAAADLRRMREERTWRIGRSGA